MIITVYKLTLYFIFYFLFLVQQIGVERIKRAGECNNMSPIQITAINPATCAGNDGSFSFYTNSINVPYTQYGYTVYFLLQQFYKNVY